MGRKVSCYCLISIYSKFKPNTFSKSLLYNIHQNLIRLPTGLQLVIIKLQITSMHLQKMQQQKKPLKKNKKNQTTQMTVENLKICAQNQQGYQTLHLNDSLKLQYCGFQKIQNLNLCANPLLLQQQYESPEKFRKIHPQQSLGVNTLYLNNNNIKKIQNLEPLKFSLVTLNLSNNQIITIQGLRELKNLCILDLSANLIEEVKSQQVSSLKKLTRINLSKNRLTSHRNLMGLLELQALETLQMSDNIHFEEKRQGLELLTNLLSKLPIKILQLKQTPFARTVPSYRKETIHQIRSLTYLDDRPVSEEELFMIKAWKKGGLRQEREARKIWTKKKQDKNNQIIQEIQERNGIIEGKVEKIFFKKAQNQLEQLEKLKEKKKSSQFQLMDLTEASIIETKIEQLNQYLVLLKEQCRGLDLDQELGLKKIQPPKNYIQKVTPEAIYIYNVSEEQLELIKKKHYPEQTRPLKAVNYAKRQELEWVDEYGQVLKRVYQLCKGNWDLIVPTFNLQVYEFDQQSGRKLRRFQKEKLIKKLKEIGGQCNQTTDRGSEVTFSHQKPSYPANELDTLD